MAKTQREKASGIPLDLLKEKVETQELQLHGRISNSRKTSRFEQDPYNEYQNFLYNRALTGLSVYSIEELQEMRFDKKKRITKVHKRAQTLLNLWKQEIVNKLSNYVFKTIFPDSPITKELTEIFADTTDELYINKMSFKSLQITKSQVIERFVEEGILPKNFNELVPGKKGERIEITSSRDLEKI